MERNLQVGICSDAVRNLSRIVLNIHIRSSRAASRPRPSVARLACRFQYLPGILGDVPITDIVHIPVPAFAAAALFDALKDLVSPLRPVSISHSLSSLLVVLPLNRDLLLVDFFRNTRFQSANVDVHCVRRRWFPVCRPIYLDQLFQFERAASNSSFTAFSLFQEFNFLVTPCSIWIEDSRTLFESNLAGSTVRCKAG